MGEYQKLKEETYLTLEKMLAREPERWDCGPERRLRGREPFGVGGDEEGSSIGSGRGGIGSSALRISEPGPGEGNPTGLALSTKVKLKRTRPSMKVLSIQQHARGAVVVGLHRGVGKGSYCWPATEDMVVVLAAQGWGLHRSCVGCTGLLAVGCYWLAVMGRCNTRDGCGWWCGGWVGCIEAAVWWAAQRLCWLPRGVAGDCIGAAQGCWLLVGCSGIGGC
ncbi:hypothetical protein Acr_00g0089690 [Actinidia rufa]|uniref:Uncharacterized protein n=1 Tax=Actinidia rufa TaxID=165716 RepID=A0A7J0DWS0_9ERIC|nr:hypothetical protein Acr_00g0089690 [Actinidia rufa]